ncbi:MAG: hypothetical protein WD875_03355 [Pirellulales bacterium]
MSTLSTAAEILEQEFLIVRAKLLETAAAFDRLDRAEGSVAADPRWQKLHQALEVLAASDPNRAEQLQLLFSLPYDARWREKFGISQNGKAIRP